MKRYCRNCYHPLPYKAKYCAHCGQKDTDGRVSMKGLLLRLWNNTFHLEGKFIRTAWQLFIPGKMTVEFFKGKQERYPHPLRLFAITMFLFLFVLNHQLKNKYAAQPEDAASYSTERKTERGDTVEVEQTITTYDRMKYSAMLYDLQRDYSKLPDAAKTPGARKVVDTLIWSFCQRYSLDEPENLDSISATQGDSIGLGINVLGEGSGVQIATLDMVRYEPDEIIRRYHITNWLEKLLVKQGIKSYKTPDALAHAYVGSLTWSILALVAMMSGVLVLLYWRQRRYYVEHFIFLLHFHTGTMLLLLLAIGGQLLGIWGKGPIIMAASLPVPGSYLAMLRFYGQGWFKTLIKWLLYGFLYLIAFALCFILGLIAVFAMF